MNAPVFLFFNFGGGEIFIILIFVLLFFGAKQLPEIARTLGKGIREVRNATDEIKREITESARDINVARDVEREVRDAASELTGTVSRKSPSKSSAASHSEQPNPQSEDEPSADAPQSKNEPSADTPPLT